MGSADINSRYFHQRKFGLNLLPTGSVILVQRTSNEDLFPLLVTSPPGNGNTLLETIVLSQSQLCPLFIKEE